MMLLPKKIGPFTLVRKLGTGGVSETYAGVLDDAERKKVAVRRVLPYILQDQSRLASVEARVKDLLGVRHPFLVQVLDWVREEDQRFAVEDWVEGCDLDRVIAWCRKHNRSLPHNVFLNLATQVCNGLEALHGRPGKGSGAENVLHLGLKPGALFATPDGKVVVGSYALTRSPTSLPHGGVAGPIPTRMEYLSPEQTHPDQKLTPASDIFALGSVLYELLTLEPLFRADSNLQTIHRVRKAEVTRQLLQVKEIMPGLDKVLYRALSLNPRHRYQRAFVLREDLRGLMAGYSFSSIAEDTRSFLQPLFSQNQPDGLTPITLADAPTRPPGASGFEDDVATRIDPDPTNTAALAREALASRAAHERSEAEEVVDATEPPSRRNLPVVPPPPPPGAQTGQTIVPLDDLAFDHTDERELTGELIAQAKAAQDVPPADDFRDDEPTKLTSPAELAAAEALPEHPSLTEDRPTESHSGVEDVPAFSAPEPSIEFDFKGSAEDVPEPRSDSPLGLAAVQVPPSGPSTEEAAPTEEAKADPGPPPPPPSSTAAFLAQARAERDGNDNARSDQLAAMAPPPPPFVEAASPSEPNADPELTAEIAPTAEISDAAPPADAGPPPPPPPAFAPPPAPAAAPAPAPAAAPPPPSSSFDHDHDLDDEFAAYRGGGQFGKYAMMAAAGAVLALIVGGGILMSKDSSPVEPVPEPLAAAVPEEPSPLASAAADAEQADAEQADAEPAVADAAVEEKEPEATPSSTSDRSDQPSSTASSSSSAKSSSSSSKSSSGSSSAKSSSSSSKSSSGSSSAKSSSSSSKSNSSSSKSNSYDDDDDWLSSITDDEPEEDDLLSDTGGEGDGEASLLDLPTATPVDSYASDAARGGLAGTDVTYLEMVDTEDPSYTRSRALPLMDAEQKGDARKVKSYLDQLMQLPENRYSPVYLSKQARHYANRKDYQTAYDKAVQAERYWARIPSDLVFSTKSEIYEVQAASLQGLFYKSEDDLDLCDRAVRAWTRYLNHASTKGRSDMAGKAETQIAKLEDARQRLE